MCVFVCIYKEGSGTERGVGVYLITLRDGYYNLTTHVVGGTNTNFKMSMFSRERQMGV